MPSNDDLQSLLAKYRVAPQIQATLESALSRANDKADRQATHIHATEHVSIPKSAELQLPMNHDASPARKTLGPSSVDTNNGERPPVPPNTIEVDSLAKQEGPQGNKELSAQKPQQILSVEPIKGQLLTGRNVRISEAVEHYKGEPQRHLGAHSVGTQTPLVLTEENEALRRLQGELDHVKSQLSCLQAEVIKQFINMDGKLTALLCQCKQ